MRLITRLGFKIQSMCQGPLMGFSSTSLYDRAPPLRRFALRPYLHYQILEEEEEENKIIYNNEILTLFETYFDSITILNGTDANAAPWRARPAWRSGGFFV